MYSQEYYIYEHAKEFERQVSQAQIMQQESLALLRQIGIVSECQFLEVGCGSAEVLFALAQQVGSAATILGLDRNPSLIHFNQSRKVENLQSANLQFKLGLAENFTVHNTFNITYTRFLLAHSRNPIRILRNMSQCTMKYGHVVLEDVDILTMRAEPWCKEIEELKAMLYILLKIMGGNARVGRQLGNYLNSIGLKKIQEASHQPYGSIGAIKEFPYRALLGVKHLFIKTGIVTPEHLSHLEYRLKELTYDSSVVLFFPRIYQSIGYKP